jgi:hypothetical protein
VSLLSIKWVEGIDYSIEKTSEGQEIIKCLHCGRQISSKAGLGPHLTVCAKKKEEAGGGGPEATGKQAEVPEEADVLKDILIKFGVKEKRAEGIAMLMAHAGWDNYNELRYYLDCAGVNPDRALLILKAWSNHRGTAIPPEVFAELNAARFQPYGLGYYPTQFVTKKDLEELIEKQTLLAKIESLEKKVSQPQSQTQNDLQLKFFEFLSDRIKSLEERIHNQPSFFEQLAGFEKVLSVLGYQKAGKTTIDVIDAISERVDQRAAQLLERFYPAAQQFKPEIKRVPEERLKKAEEIKQKLEKSEEILLAEDELVKAAAKVRPRGSST